MKLTPAKRLKQLKANGWLNFVEWMEKTGYSPYDLQDGDSPIEQYRTAHAHLILMRRMERDIFSTKYNNELPKMMGLAEQLGI